MEKKTEGRNVYLAISAVQAALAAQGIGKGKKNKEQGYSFRGIDDVYNTLAPMLASNGLCILPRILKREMTERKTAKGNPLFSVIVEAEFDFVSADDSSTHVVRTFGEAMDTADKATNKAMSAAYKYACLQAFCIPTEGDNDADGRTHEVAVEEGEFETQELRDAFVANCVESIRKSQNGSDLMTVKDCNLAKWNAMKDSSVAADFDAYNRIITEAYNPRYAELKKLSEQKPKPATVDGAIANG